MPDNRITALLAQANAESFARCARADTATREYRLMMQARAARWALAARVAMGVQS